MHNLAIKCASAFLLSTISVAALAQVASSPFEDLANALNPPATDQQVFDRWMEVDIPETLAQDPDLMALDEVCPGSLTVLVESGRSLLKEDFIRDQDRYRREVAALFADRLSPEHAAEVAALYSTPLGKKLVQSVGDNQSLDFVMEEALADPYGDTTAEALAKDDERTLREVVQRLTLAEKRELSDLFGKSPGFRAFEAIQDELVAIRTRIELETANEEDPELEAAMEQALGSHLASCPALAE
ncbi:DUF2059 domain-containing protein [Erythrobacter sp. SDW2]|uniref:DUF2059 domain-containing protein n=1 Tax=Erythrobacter sp. SDW2 TaxID=2907154 RepID=UPI001F412CBC|nr:DUF2059 domain-containing protein [Erythrobacter sp. SDW2]UIP07695.1 DUF2059 domain-containing protein [Erythrobacter sp. SDW2]